MPPEGEAARAVGESHEHTQTNEASSVAARGEGINAPEVAAGNDGFGYEGAFAGGSGSRHEPVQAEANIPRHPAIREAISDLKKRAVEVSPVLIHLLLAAASRIEDGKLRIETETGFFARIIQDSSEELAESLRKYGITSFSIGIMPEELLARKRREDERLECLKEIQKQAIQRKKQKEQQQQQERQEEELRRELSSLPPAKQFDILVAAYPRQSVYGDYFPR